MKPAPVDEVGIGVGAVADDEKNDRAKVKLALRFIDGPILLGKCRVVSKRCSEEGKFERHAACTPQH